MDLYNFYKQRISDIQVKESECIKKERVLPFYRLLIIVVGLVAFYILFQINIITAVIVLLLFLVAFAFVVRIDNQNLAKRKELQLFKMLNENEINYLDGVCSLDDDGSRYKNESHSYSNDLDIFGNSSLFHFINRTTLTKSSDILSDWLLSPADTQEINDRNEAVKELSEKIDWRQKIFITGYTLKKNQLAINNLINWIKKSGKFSFSKKFILFCAILSSITAVVLAFSFVFSSFYILYLLLIIQYFIVLKSNKIVKHLHNEVTNNAEILETYSAMLKQIENEKF